MKLKLNVLVAVIAVAIIALWGGLALIAEGQTEYAAAVIGAAITALAWLMKSLTDPDVPMVPASVVMALIAGEDPPEGDGPRFQMRPNALVCLMVIGVLAVSGGWMLSGGGSPELAYAVYALGIGAVAATLSDLVKPSDKDVPMPVAEQLIARLLPAESNVAA